MPEVGEDDMNGATADPESVTVADIVVEFNDVAVAAMDIGTIIGKK